MNAWVGARAHTGNVDIHINLNNVVAITYTPDRPDQDQEGQLQLYVTGGEPIVYHGVTAERLYAAIEDRWVGKA